MSATAQDAVALAVTEAVNNASIHAFAQHDDGGHISLEAGVHDGRLHVVISDDGSGMRPRTDRPGLGAGLLIIAQLAERLRIDGGPRGGTRVSMDFALR